MLYLTGWMLVCPHISHKIMLEHWSRTAEHGGLCIMTVAGSMKSGCVVHWQDGRRCVHWAVHTSALNFDE